jgi:hypothetical protein
MLVASFARLLSSPPGRALLVAGGLMLSAGCATEIEPGGADADTAELHGFLSIDRATDPTSDEPTVREQASASFLRTRDGTDAQVVARLVGAVPSLPAAGQCAQLGVDDPALALHTLSPVELVQVGDVSLSSSASLKPLVARAYPDVAHLVSGVVYTTADVGSDVAHDRVKFSISGGADVAGFDVELDVPEPLSDVRVNGATLRAAALPERLAPGAVTIGWAAASLGADDTVYVDLAWEGTTRASRLRCTADGKHPSLTLDAAAADGSTLVLSVHRLRTVRFPESPLSTTEVRLDTAVSGRVAFGQPGLPRPRRGASSGSAGAGKRPAPLPGRPEFRGRLATLAPLPCERPGRLERRGRARTAGSEAAATPGAVAPGRARRLPGGDGPLACCRQGRAGAARPVGAPDAGARQPEPR